MGASASGSLAVGTTLRALDDSWGVDKIMGSVAIVPVTVHPDAVLGEVRERGEYVSYKEHANSGVNTASAMGAFFRIVSWNDLKARALTCCHIDAHCAPKDDIYISPLLHPKLASFPRTYMCACEMDVLRDDARLFKYALQTAR